MEGIMDKKALYAAIAGFVAVVFIDLGNIYIWSSHPVPPEAGDAKDIIVAVVQGGLSAIFIYLAAVLLG